MNDLKFACRQLLKNPGFTAVAVLTLALGIGANTAIFGVLNELLLRPLPIREPGQLLGVVLADGSDDFANQSIPYPIVQDYREQMNGIFREFTACASTFCLAEAGEGSRQFVMTELVTGSYFSTLGIVPEIGRMLGEPDNRLTVQGAVAVISHGAWWDWFNGDPSVIGQTVTLRPNFGEAVHATVVGVAPAGFNGIERSRPQIWLPAVLEKQFKDAAPVNFRMIGRLAEGVSQSQAESALDVVAATVAAKHGGRVIPGYGNEGIFRSDLRTELRHAALGSWGAFRSHAPLRRARMLAFGVAALVLLIACANIANLILARAERRRRDTAIRLSLGASRGRVMRAALVESLLISVLGGVAGLVLAQAGNRLLFAFRPADTELLVLTNLDLRVAGFCFVLALVSGMIVGLLPAWRSSREDPNRALKERGGRSHAGGVRIRDAFAITQIALSMILLVGAGLCLRSFAGLLGADPGFRADRLITANLNFGNVPEGGGPAHYRALVERLSAMPGVETVSWARAFPIVPAGGGISVPIEQIEGYEPGPNEFLVVEFTEVAPGFFETLGMARATAPVRSLESAVTQVWANEAFVRRYWLGKDPVGRSVGNWQIDGVIKDIRVKNLWDPAIPYLYVQQSEPDAASGMFFIRTRAEPAAMLGQIRAALLAMDPQLDISRLMTMRETLGQTLRAQKFMVVLLGAFAGCAVLLALIGIYGVVSYVVSQRTREIGVRMALGAGRGTIMADVLRRGGWLTAAGVVLGLFGSWGTTRVLQSVIHEISPTDPATFASVTIILTAAAMLACLLPARRASRVDPMVALRLE